jgi:type IV pilus assembly protein PilZ
MVASPFEREPNVIEQRRHARAPIDTPLFFFVKGKEGELEGVGKDISVGGMAIDTKTPAAFNAEVIVHVSLPGSDEILALPGVVRWVRGSIMGVQFGLLGAIETHVITEIARKHAEEKGSA